MDASCTWTLHPTEGVIVEVVEVVSGVEGGVEEEVEASEVEGEVIGVAEVASGVAEDVEEEVIEAEVDEEAAEGVKSYFIF